MIQRLTTRLLLTLTLVATTVPAPAATPSPEELRVYRLARIGRLWAAAKFLHPSLVDGHFDWDKALVSALPQLRAARTPTEFSAGVTTLLEPLHDPLTRLYDPKRDQAVQASGSASQAHASPLFSTLGTNDLLIDLTDLSRWDAGRWVFYRQRQALLDAVQKADRVVIDIRPLRPGQGQGSLEPVWQALGPALTTRGLVSPALRERYHSGYSPQQGTSSGGYGSGLLTLSGTSIPASPNAKDHGVVFIVNGQSDIPPIALALQDAGTGRFLSEGPFSDEQLVRKTYIPLDNDHTAWLRTSELVHADGHTGLQADATMAPTETHGPRCAAVLSALALAPSGSELVSRKATPMAAPLPDAQDRAYPEMAYPSVDYRLLALFRAWAVVHYFFPYRDLMDTDWDDLLVRFIPRMEAARNAQEYALTLAELMAHLQDSHVSVNGTELNKLFWSACPPFRLRIIEDQPVVTRLFEPTVAKAAGLEVGDRLLTIEGQPALEYVRRNAKYFAASTHQARDEWLMQTALNGTDGSDLHLTVEDCQGKRHPVVVARKATYFQAFFTDAAETSKPTYRFLDGDTGYVDLMRLTTDQIDAMFLAFTNTKAIVFDLRGYPNGTAWSLAPRLNTQQALTGASFRRPVAGAGFMEGMFLGFQQQIYPTRKPLYTGKTVTLIDARAISQAEHTGLFFEAVNGTTFIGSPTTGANGDVTNFVLPGGISVSFTGHDVRHADGRRLQRVGLIPDIEAHPTIAGFRAGRDEVLERARQFLKSGH